MRGHFRGRLPLIPPTPFSHTGRRGSLGVLMPERGDGTQGLPEKSTPVKGAHLEGLRRERGRPARTPARCVEIHGTECRERASPLCGVQ
jgi:hypothetical protein